MPPQPPKSKRKKVVILSIITAVILGVFGWWLYGTMRTYPLGNKLEYIGKTDVGCYVICDSGPSSTYYYATNMRINEIANYFHSTIERQPTTIDDKTYFGIKTPSDETIYTYYYMNKDDLSRKYNLKSSSEPYILELPSFKYNTAQSSLQLK